jgi:hypothetical protein
MKGDFHSAYGPESKPGGNRARSGGGATMNKVTHSGAAGVRAGSRSTGAANEGPVSRIGTKHVLMQPERPLESPRRGATPLGNELAAKTTCGPGGSREVLPTGSQGKHGGD